MENKSEKKIKYLDCGDFFHCTVAEGSLQIVAQRLLHQFVKAVNL